MLTKLQLVKYAKVLVWGLETARTKPYKPYDSILIRYHLEAAPLAEYLFRELIQKKLNVIPRCLNTPVMEHDFYSFTDSKQRKFIAAGEKEFYGKLAGNIFLNAPSSLTHLKDIDSKKINDVMVTRKKLREIMIKREENGDFGWTLCTLPTEELAKKAKLSLKEYTNQVVKACFLNDKNPVSKWKQVYKESVEIKKWLNSLGIKTIHVESKSMDLEILFGEKRKFIGISGHNIPSFEIFTSPDWRGTRGTFYADQPSFRNGNYVEKVKLLFEKGRVIKISAGKGENFVKNTLTMDRGASQVGEFSLTDKRFSKIDAFMADTLFDENYGGKFGNCHIAVGSSYSDTYNGNVKNLNKTTKKSLGYNDSALHWDLVNTEDKIVTATLKSGKKQVIYEKGMFKH
ncbi:MAG: aminopeptidase [Spirochaetes bacterium]|nr:aminopeptidase [Spirochaetota bacterium]